MPEYESLKTAFQEAATDEIISVLEATVDAVLQLIESQNPPLRLFLGNQGYPWVRQVYESRFEEWEEWKNVSADIREII